MTCFYIHNLFLLRYIFNSRYGLCFLTLLKNYIQDVPIPLLIKSGEIVGKKNKLRIYHESGKKWVVRVRIENSTPIITDGLDSVVKDLNLPRDTLLVFRPLGDFGLELSCFVDGMCGWPEMCNDVGILEDDLLVFSRIDDVVFDIVVYRDETEICFSKKPESDDDSVLEISKADYVENVFKDIYEDEEVVSVDERRSVTQKLRTNAKCTSKRRMSSRLNKTQDVKKKGKVTSERKETVKNMTKGNAALPVDTSDHIGCSSSAHKVKVSILAT
ncbi:putative transcription factor B3-Domain family [Helianthus annuus]|nr:putative transcription factor B3-Domain family [Helianthus annuus]